MAAGSAGSARAACQPKQGIDKLDPASVQERQRVGGSVGRLWAAAWCSGARQCACGKPERVPHPTCVPPCIAQCGTRVHCYPHGLRGAGDARARARRAVKRKGSLVPHACRPSRRSPPSAHRCLCLWSSQTDRLLFMPYPSAATMILLGIVLASCIHITLCHIVYLEDLFHFFMPPGEPERLCTGEHEVT